MYNLSLKVKDETENFESTEKLQEAYIRLKENFLNKEFEQTDIYLLEQENSELRKQMNFLQKSKFTHLGADVIGKNLDPLGSTLIINRGLNDGIKEGEPVIAGEGVLIGIIARVEQSSSVVRLINDNQSKIAATVANLDRSVGIVEGGYGLSIKMNFIPQNESITVGDVIITSGLQNNIPRGLQIGVVAAVEKEAYQPFQNAVVTPFVNLEKINLVSIIIL